MPEEGIKQMRHAEILSFEEIIGVVKEAVLLGIDKFRLTGGEPLVRKNIVSLVKQISEIDGIKDLSLTTNGILLGDMAVSLKNAGLHRVNISLDATDAEKYCTITRGGNIEKVFEGIEAAKLAGLNPIKLNCVIFKSSDEPNAKAVKEYAEKNGLQVRFIHQMNLETGEFSVVEGGNGGNCKQCNRLRLTANGMIKPCLFDENEYSVRELGAKQALLNALNNKPLNGCLNKTGSFYAIGG
jgi:cyclic pyranopterin phosphate synthase